MNCPYPEIPRASVLTALTLLCATWIPVAFAQSDTEDSISWPRQLDAEKGQIIIYQPQLESFQNDIIEARSAVSVTPKDQTNPIFGACWFMARVATDFDTREVSLLNLNVTDTKFPDMEGERIAQLTSFLEEEMPRWDMTFSLDRLLASMEAIEARTEAAAGLNNEPPEIIYVDHPAVLVLIDGEPILAQMENSDLKYVVNSPYYIVQDTGSKQYYLKGGDYWFATQDLKGSWQTTEKLPKSVAEVAQQIEEAEKQQAAEQEQQAVTDEDSEELGEVGIPEIIVRTQPAELIQVNGESQFAPIEGTELLYIQNSESDIIMEVASQQYFILISGRWYASSSLSDGSWVFVPFDELPAEFTKIPADSDMGQVLSSVAGTQEAKEVVLENQIPQTAEIDRKEATVTVTYDGDPQFEKCGDEGVAYAINTDKSVLLIDGTYYCCDNAVWFVARGPEGPWEVCDSVPEQVQSIPPECPVYNVKYVYIYDSTPEVVYVGYTPAYLGSYYYGGCVVWGTGWWYRPWYHRYYYPRPVTWGFHVHYNPVSGWGFSFGVSAGWLHIRVGRPWYGGWWGVGGYRHGYRHGYHRGYRHGYHHGARAGYRAGYRAGQRQAHSNVYRNRSTGVRSTGPPRTSSSPAHAPATRDRPATTQREPKQSRESNNVYADRNGDIHRKQGDSWQKREGNNWSSEGDRSGSQRDRQNLDRDYNSRQRGNQKANQSRSSRSGSRGGRRR